MSEKDGKSVMSPQFSQENQSEKGINQSQNKKIEKKKGSFFSGVAVLTLSTLIVKLIGVLYKIPLFKYLGEEGMGYFNSAYEIYAFFYMIATAGLPVAISILVSENLEKGKIANVKKVYSVSLILFLILGLSGTAFLYFGADWLGNLIENSGAVLCIAAIAPMALFTCVSSAVRGFFQGYQNMVPTAVSQIIEAAGKLGLGLVLAVFAIKEGYALPYVAAFATRGVAIGVGLSMLYLLLAKFFGKERKRAITPTAELPEKSETILAKLVKIAVPITISSTVISLTRLIDLFMILRRLQEIGYTEEAANAIYGSYSTLAVSMFNLPSAFVTPIALALVPVLTAALSSSDRYKEKNTLNASLRLCALITLPASLGLSLFSDPILSLVFHGETSAIRTAAPLLSVLALSVFFSCLMTVTNAILQAYGKEQKPILSMAIGAGVKTVVAYVLIGLPAVHIYGAPISTFVCVLTVSVINMGYIKKCTGSLESIATLFTRPLMAAAVSVGAGGGIYFLLRRWRGESSGLTLLTIAVTAVLYGLSALKIHAVGEADLLLLPQGEKLCKLLRKIRLI